MSITTTELSPQLYDYLIKNCLREPEILAELRQETHDTFESAPMQIAPEQGQLMHFLVKLIGAKKILEIGTYTGYSSIAMALALPGDGKLIACDTSYDWTRMAVKFWEKAGLTDKIELHLAPALKTLTNLLNNGKQDSFDFIFIDADKANYNHYYEQSLRLIRPGGIIAIDNLFWEGDVADLSKNDDSTIAIRELNKKLQIDTRISYSIVTIGDGLGLAHKL